MTDLAEIARVAHGAYHSLKQDAVDRASGPSDLVSILTVVAAGAGPIIVACPYGLLPGAIRLFTAGREPEVLTYSADAWIKTTPLEPGLWLPRPEHGQLANAFHAGDMTVREALYTTVVTKDASHTLVGTYRYDDRGRVVFDETDVAAGPFGGVIDQLRLAWA